MRACVRRNLTTPLLVTNHLLAARWTSLAAPDPFVIAAAGRAYLRMEDLIRLAEQIRDLLA
jgi:hypothetical protein